MGGGQLEPAPGDVLDLIEAPGGEGKGRGDAQHAGPLAGREPVDGVGHHDLLHGQVHGPAAHEVAGQAQPELGLRRRRLPAGQEVDAGLLRFGVAGRRLQAEHPVGQEGVTPGGACVEEGGRALEEVGRGGRRPDGGVVGRPQEPLEGGGVARERTPDEVLGHLQRRGAPLGQHVGDVEVHGMAQ